MALGTPNSEDLKKLHAEVNLNFHERFLITTLAITIFGVLGGWLFSKSPPTPGAELGGFSFAVSILLTLLLLVLFLYSFFLRRQLRVVTSYLIVTKCSAWEVDWKNYRTHNYSGYWKAQSTVFLFLGGFTFFFPLIIKAIYSSKLDPAIGFYIHLAVSVVYFFIVYMLGFREMPGWEENIIKRWEGMK